MIPSKRRNIHSRKVFVTRKIAKKWRPAGQKHGLFPTWKIRSLFLEPCAGLTWSKRFYLHVNGIDIIIISTSET